VVTAGVHDRDMQLAQPADQGDQLHGDVFDRAS
jgi:hypothetical protein